MSFSLASGSASRKVCIGVCRSTSDPDEAAGIEISLQLVDAAVDLLAERDAITSRQEPDAGPRHQTQAACSGTL